MSGMNRCRSLLALGFTIAFIGAALAGVDEGVRALDRKDHAAALREFRAAADRGDARAQYYLGRIYLMGEGVATDYRKAATFFHKAAGQGHRAAQSYLGTLHHLGAGVAKDRAQAVRWYRRAAGQGDRIAQYQLGALHAAGDGVPRDHVEAYMWFALAAAAGSERASKFAEIIARGMPPADIAKAKRLARERKRTTDRSPPKP